MADSGLASVDYTPKRRMHLARTTGQPREPQPLISMALRAGTMNWEFEMRAFASSFRIDGSLCLCAVAPASAGSIYGISYTDISSTSSTNLTTAGAAGLGKMGQRRRDRHSQLQYLTNVRRPIINPALTPLGTVPQGPDGPARGVCPVVAPDPDAQLLWTNGTNPEAGGMPVSTSVSRANRSGAQFSYPLGLGLSFQVAASATPEELSLYVVRVQHQDGSLRDPEWRRQRLADRVERGSQPRTVRRRQQ